MDGDQNKCKDELKILQNIREEEIVGNKNWERDREIDVIEVFTEMFIFGHKPEGDFGGIIQTR